MAPPDSAKIALGVLAVAGVGLVLYLLVKRHKKSRKANDSVTTSVVGSKTVPEKDVIPAADGDWQSASISQTGQGGTVEERLDLTTVTAAETAPSLTEEFIRENASQLHTVDRDVLSDDSSRKEGYIEEEDSTTADSDTASVVTQVTLASSVTDVEDIALSPVKVEGTFLDSNSNLPGEDLAQGDFSGENVQICEEMPVTEASPDLLEQTKPSHENGLKEDERDEIAEEKSASSEMPPETDLVKQSEMEKAGDSTSTGEEAVVPDDQKGKNSLGDDITSVKSGDVSDGEALSFEQINYSSDDVQSLEGSDLQNGVGAHQFDPVAVKMFPHTGLATHSLEQAGGSNTDSLKSFEQISESGNSGSFAPVEISMESASFIPIESSMEVVQSVDVNGSDQSEQLQHAPIPEDSGLMQPSDDKDLDTSEQVEESMSAPVDSSIDLIQSLEKMDQDTDDVQESVQSVAEASSGARMDQDTPEHVQDLAQPAKEEPSSEMIQSLEKVDQHASEQIQEPAQPSSEESSMEASQVPEEVDQNTSESTISALVDSSMEVIQSVEEMQEQPPDLAESEKTDQDSVEQTEEFTEQTEEPAEQTEEVSEQAEESSAPGVDSTQEIAATSEDVTSVTEDAKVQDVTEDAEVPGVTEDAQFQDVTEDANVQNVTEDAGVPEVTEDAKVQEVTEDATVKEESITKPRRPLSDGGSIDSFKSFGLVRGSSGSTEFYSSESLASFQTAHNDSSTSGSMQDFYSPISSPATVHESSKDDTSFSKGESESDAAFISFDADTSQELNFDDPQTMVEAQDRTPTNTPVTGLAGEDSARTPDQGGWATPDDRDHSSSLVGQIRDSQAGGDGGAVIPSDSFLAPHESRGQENLHVNQAGNGQVETTDVKASSMFTLGIDKDKMTAAILQAQTAPDHMEISHLQVLTQMLGQEDKTLVNTALQNIIRVSAFTLNVNILRFCECPKELTRLLEKFGAEVVQDPQAAKEGSPSAETLLLSVVRAITNLAMDIKTQPQLEGSLPLLTDLLQSEGLSEGMMLATLQPLTNMSSTSAYHGHFTRIVHQLYGLLDTSHNSALRLQCLKVLVNLSLNADMVPHMLAAKAPECLLELIDINCNIDLLLRTVTFVANVMAIMQERDLTPSSLPPDEKAPSPETMHAALFSLDRRDVLRNKVYRLTRHDSEDVCYQASRLYKYITTTK